MAEKQAALGAEAAAKKAKPDPDKIRLNAMALALKTLASDRLENLRNAVPEGEAAYILLSGNSFKFDADEEPDHASY